MAIKKVYRCYRIGLAFKERDNSYYGDYERITVVAPDEVECDNRMKAHRQKYVLSNDELTVVESVTPVSEPDSIVQDSFIMSDDEIWF